MTNNSGYLVTTKKGLKGRTYHSKEPIRGKIPVYLHGQETPILCYPQSLKIIGFID